MSILISAILLLGNMQDGRTALHCAISEGHRDIAQLLVQAGANIDLQEYVNTYLMFIYAVYRHVDTYICYHIGNMQDGETALHWVIYNGHLDIAQLLIQAGVNIDLQDNVSTSLMFLYAVYIIMLTLISAIILVTCRVVRQHYTLQAVMVILISPSCWYRQGLILILRTK